MVEKFTGIVLRTLKYSDNLMIADIFTETRGRLSFLVPVSRKNTKVKNVLFQPLAMLDFCAVYKQEGKMARLGEVRLRTVYSAIPYEPCKSAVALFLAEFLTRALREGGDNAALFGFIEKSLLWFDEASSGYADFHILFLMRLTRFLGIFPNLENAHRGVCFDLVAGCFAAEQPLHGHFLARDDAAAVFSLLSLEYDELGGYIKNRKMRCEYLAVVLDYYRLHLPDFPDLKSVEVLKELFDD